MWLSDEIDAFRTAIIYCNGTVSQFSIYLRSAVALFSARSTSETAHSPTAHLSLHPVRCFALCCTIT